MTASFDGDEIREFRSSKTIRAFGWRMFYISIFHFSTILISEESLIYNAVVDDVSSWPRNRRMKSIFPRSSTANFAPANWCTCVNAVWKICFYLYVARKNVIKLATIYNLNEMLRPSKVPSQMMGKSLALAHHWFGGSGCFISYFILTNIVAVQSQVYCLITLFFGTNNFPVFGITRNIMETLALGIGSSTLG